MLSMTESAGQHLTDLLENDPEQTVLRFVAAEQGLAIEKGQVQPNDITLQHGERTVLAMDAAINTALTDKTLDVQTTEQGAQLTLG